MPDACPDILRIVDVCGQATLSGKQAREGAAQVTGMVPGWARAASRMGASPDPAWSLIWSEKVKGFSCTAHSR